MSAGDRRGQGGSREASPEAYRVTWERDDGGLEDRVQQWASSEHWSGELPSACSPDRVQPSLASWKAQLTIPVCPSTADTYGDLGLYSSKAGPTDAQCPAKVLFHSQQRGQSD